MKKRITHSRLFLNSLFFLLLINTGLLAQSPIKGTAKGKVENASELTPAGVTTMPANNPAPIADENPTVSTSTVYSFGTVGVVFNASLGQNVKAILKNTTATYNQYLIYTQTTATDNMITQFASALDQKVGVQSCEEVNLNSSNRTEITSVIFDLGLSEVDILDIIANTIF